MLTCYRRLRAALPWSARLFALLLVASAVHALPARPADAALIRCMGNACDGFYNVDFTPTATTPFEVDLDATFTIQNNSAISWAFNDPAITIAFLNIIPFIDELTSEIRLGDLVNFTAPLPESMFINANGTYDCLLQVHCLAGTYAVSARIAEPATLLLFVTGLLVVGFLARRRDLKAIPESI